MLSHSNETHAPIANPPNSGQLGGTPTIPPTCIRVRAVMWECGDGQTGRHTDTQTRVSSIHFASSTTHTKCNDVDDDDDDERIYIAQNKKSSDALEGN